MENKELLFEKQHGKWLFLMETADQRRQNFVRLRPVCETLQACGLTSSACSCMDLAFIGIIS